MAVGLRHRLFWFAVAGVLGFAVNAGALKALVLAGLDPRLAQAPAILVALTSTWLVNRSRTFGDRAGRPTLAEFLRYAMASALSASVNYAVFCLLVSLGGPFAAMPVATLVPATLASMTVSFVVYSRLVFSARRPRVASAPERS